jgi:phage terminase large subunit-like protein
MKWSQHILDANWCGWIPPCREYDNVVNDPKTKGERVIAFAHHFLKVPEGMSVGQPLRLDEFQIFFLLALLDNPHGTRDAYLSIGRRNGKTFVIAVLLLAYIVGPLAVQNSALASGALSREQAGLVFKLMEKMLVMSPALSGTYKIIPSSKKILGLALNTEYSALSADAKTGHGQSLLVILLDEAGQIKGPTSPFVEMLASSQGSYAAPLMVTISTQAPTDADYLSIHLDAAKRDKPATTICHVYTTDANCELDDESQWLNANPGLGRFRSVQDLRKQLQDAKRMPASESAARNLLLNQRTAVNNLWISRTVWKENCRAPDMDVLRTKPVHVGLDLSMRNDLTAAVCSARDDAGFVHMRPFIFAPEVGMRERALRDKADYETWVRQGLLIAVPGRTVDYEWVAIFLREKCADMFIASIQFDRWGIENFKRAAQGVGLEVPDWVPVGQGYRDFSPRLKSFESALLKGRICHGDHPLLNMSVSNAICVEDPSGNQKLDKASSTLRIDPLVAAVMSAYPCADNNTTTAFNIESFII